MGLKSKLKGSPRTRFPRSCASAPRQDLTGGTPVSRNSEPALYFHWTPFLSRPVTCHHWCQHMVSLPGVGTVSTDLVSPVSAATTVVHQHCHTVFHFIPGVAPSRDLGQKIAARPGRRWHGTHALVCQEWFGWTQASLVEWFQSVDLSKIGHSELPTEQSCPVLSCPVRLSYSIPSQLIPPTRRPSEPVRPTPPHVIPSDLIRHPCILCPPLRSATASSRAGPSRPRSRPGGGGGGGGGGVSLPATRPAFRRTNGRPGRAAGRRRWPLVSPVTPDGRSAARPLHGFIGRGS